MNKIKSLAIIGLACIVLGFNSCSPEFLDRKPTTAINADGALNSVSNVQAATVGLMMYFATSSYTGRNLPIIGDLITDNLSTKAGNSGHMLDIEIWNIHSALSEAGSFWGGSYQIASAAAKVIQASDNLLKGDVSDNDKKSLNRCKATALTIKAFAEYILTQYYCLPYSASGKSAPWGGQIPEPDRMNGIILVPMDGPVSSDNAIDATSTLETASLGATYRHMHTELERAIALYEEADAKQFNQNNAAYFPSKSMAWMLKARLYLEQAYINTALFDSARICADEALGELPNGAEKELVGEQMAFLEQYRTIAKPTTEDILTVNFTPSDNLSANSINNMFGSYGCRASDPLRELIKSGDIRQKIYMNKSEDKDLEIYSACGKYPNKDQINNVPVLRVPELYLIKAEVAANQSNGNLDHPEFQEAMLATLGVRDTTIHGDYQKLKEKYFKEENMTALDYVLDERRREFTGEGHRWFDLRRTGKPLTRSGESFRITFTGYPIQFFAFPIPESETNTGAWGNGKLHQNEPWNEDAGKSWTSRIQLPIDGGNYN